MDSRGQSCFSYVSWKITCSCHDRRWSDGGFSTSIPNSLTSRHEKFSHSKLRSMWVIANTRATLAQQLSNDFRQPQHMPFSASGSLAFLFRSSALNAASGPEVLRSFVFFFGPFTLNTARGPTENHVTQAYFVFKNMSR